jgi:hypothetical protein
MQMNNTEEEKYPNGSQEDTMLQRQIPVEHVAPWLVSGASGLYIMARARRLSLARASKAPLSHFLMHQSDVILMLCGSPAVWYFVRRHRRRLRIDARDVAFGPTAQAIHQLRQIFTALQIGTGLLARKITAGKTADLASLAQRLNRTVRDGIEILSTMGEPYLPDLVDEHGALRRPVGNNGM